MGSVFKYVSSPAVGHGSEVSVGKGEAGAAAMPSIDSGVGAGTASCISSKSSYDGKAMSSSWGRHCSSSERDLDGVEVYEGWFDYSGALRRGDEGAEDGKDAGSLEVS